MDRYLENRLRYIPQIAPVLVTGITILTGYFHPVFGQLSPTEPKTSTITVDVKSPQQTIDGFGICTAWGTIPHLDDTAEMDALFSVSKGAGFSILRNRIPFQGKDHNDALLGNGNFRFQNIGVGENSYKNFSLNWHSWDLGMTRRLIAALKARGSDYQVNTIFSTPWTPPNNTHSRWKLPSKGHLLDYNNAPEIGGYLDPAHYQDYADVLADYVLQFNDPSKGNMGMPLNALSLQNEPNIPCTYESADWSGQQMHDFIAVLKKEFMKKGVYATMPNLKIMAPESPNFKEDLLLPTLADPQTQAVVQIVAAHQYDAGPWNIGPETNFYFPRLFTQSQALGKKIWMTEWCTAAFKKWSEIEQALVLGQLMQHSFVAVKTNAYLYWWPTLLVVHGVPNKNYYAMAHFSHFVRPGWRMVPLSNPHPQALVVLASFIDPQGKNLVVIAINRSAKDFSMKLLPATGHLLEGSVVRTSEKENMTPVENYRDQDPLVVPAMSMVTYSARLKP